MARLVAVLVTSLSSVSSSGYRDQEAHSFREVSQLLGRVSVPTLQPVPDTAAVNKSMQFFLQLLFPQRLNLLPCPEFLNTSLSVLVLEGNKGPEQHRNCVKLLNVRYKVVCGVALVRPETGRTLQYCHLTTPATFTNQLGTGNGNR